MEGDFLWRRFNDENGLEDMGIGTEEWWKILRGIYPLQVFSPRKRVVAATPRRSRCQRRLAALRGPCDGASQTLTATRRRSYDPLARAKHLQRVNTA